MSYPITQKHIALNHKEGVYINPVGVVLHSTADPGSTDEGEFNYFNTNVTKTSAHAFIDWDSITEFLRIAPDKTERAWHAGTHANNMFIGVELCEPATYDIVKFGEVWMRAVWYFAHLFTDVLHIKTVTKDNLMAHAEVSAKWPQDTDHQDPISYFKTYGKTVDNFRKEVQDMIDGVKPVPTDYEVNLKKVCDKFGFNFAYWQGKAGIDDYFPALIKGIASKI